MINRILSLSIAVMCIYLVTGTLMKQKELPGPESKRSDKQIPVSAQKSTLSEGGGATSQQANGKPFGAGTVVSSSEPAGRPQLPDIKTDAVPPVKPNKNRKPVKTQASTRSESSDSDIVKDTANHWPRQSSDTAALLEDIEHYTNN